MTRTMEVQQTAKTQKYKTLESSLQKVDAETKERSTLSSRCAEIDSLIVERMGVSEAVISNVIFCHQEDSAWPLGTAKDLKDKFDAIFSATRYTKALENIKKFRKEQQQKLLVMKNDLGHLKTHQETAKAMRETLERTKSDIERAGFKIDKIDGELEPIMKEFKKLAGSMDEIEQLQMDLAMLKSQRDELKKNQAILESKMTQTFDSDTDADLRKRMSDFETNLGTQQTRLNEAERKLREISSKKKLGNAL